LFVTWKLIAIGVLAMGCGARLGDGFDDNGDAGNGGSHDGGSNGKADSGVTPQSDAASAACPNDRKVYLNFDGVTLTRATPSDSTKRVGSARARRCRHGIKAAARAPLIS
jgi:hypothetical protein